ncbi:RDD family protein [Holosporaceae bacterium 'Namur']|nr:RDD family protein [Holosporaceae bacterium 'Namur']
MEINDKYAGFWRRFSALIIDYAIVGIISLLLTLWFINHTLGPLLFIGIIAGFSLIFFFSLIFPTICLIYSINPITSKWQGTLGKRIMGIYVINRNGMEQNLPKLKCWVGVFLFILFHLDHLYI